MTRLEPLTGHLLEGSAVSLFTLGRIAAPGDRGVVSASQVLGNHIVRDLQRGGTVPDLNQSRWR